MFFPANRTENTSRDTEVMQSSCFRVVLGDKRPGTCRDGGGAVRSVPNVAAFVWLRGYRKDER